MQNYVDIFAVEIDIFAALVVTFVALLDSLSQIKNLYLLYFVCTLCSYQFKDVYMEIGMSAWPLESFK